MVDGERAIPVAGWLKVSVSIAQRLFVPLALACLAVAAYGARDAFVVVIDQARIGPLLLTVLIWASLQMLGPVTSWIVLSGLGSTVNYRTALQVHVARLPARYLPGGIWQTVSRVVDLHALGVNRAQLSVMVAMENLAPLATALVLGGACAWAAGTRAVPAPALLCIGLGLAAVLPWLIGRTVRQVQLPILSYVLVLVSTMAFWILAAAAFVVYWLAFPSVPQTSGVAGLMATYLLAWTAGFVAVFAPQGIGVFEAVAGLLLEGSMSLGGMAVMVAGFRAMTLAGDGLAYLVGTALARSRKRDTRTR